MTFLLVVILLIFALPYIGRLLNRLILWWFSHKIQQQARRAYEQATSGFEGRSSGAPSSQPRRQRGKRIDPSVGEYIEYEDIEGAAASMTYADGTEAFAAEATIIDAEWEEIK